MAIQPRGTPTSTSIPSASPRSTNKPTGVVSGDLLIFALCFSGAISSYTPPSGSTLIAGTSISSGPTIYLYSMVAGGSEPSTYTVSWTGGGTGSIACLALYSDLGVTPTIDIAGAQLNASGDRLWPSLTAALGSEFLACFANLSTNVGSTPHAGMSEQIDNSGNPRVYLMTQTLVASGATGTRTATGTASISAAANVLISEPGIHGAAAITLDALTLAATGTVQVEAGADITLAPLTLVATGKVAIKGAAAITLAPLTMAAAGQGPPFVPTDFSAVAVTGSRIDLSWIDDGPSISGFNIERSPNGTTGWVEIATVGAAVRSYTDDGLTQNVTYYYRMRARRD